MALRDDNEKALTYTLGYVLANSYRLRDRFLRFSFGRSLMKQGICFEIEPSIPEFHSRYDILVRLDNRPRLIIEGKRHREKPYVEQCWKYIRYLRKKGNQTRDSQRLLLVFDWLQEDEIKDEIAKVKEQLNERLKKDQQTWRSHAEQYIRYLTWDEIWTWCEDILKKNRFSPCDEEGGLLTDYKNYLESDRYGHEHLDSLDLDCGEQLKTAFRSMEEVRMRHGGTLKRIPVQNDDGEDYLYAWGEDDPRRHHEGFCGYKKGIKHVFGILFRWRRRSMKEALIYVALPRKMHLSRTLQCALQRDFEDAEYRNGKWCFNLDLRSKNGIDELINGLDEKGFFRAASR